MIYRKNLLDQINTRIQSCSKCSLCSFEFNKKDVAKGYGKLYGWRGGSKKCRFFFVGMNPSYNRFAGHEYAFGGIEGSPGPGKKFNDLLKETGLFEDIFIDNLIHCSSDSNQINFESAQCCFEHLKSEIDVLEPEKVVTMGRQVFNFLAKLFGDNNIKIAMENIWHPSYVFSYQRATPEEYKTMILKVCKEKE